MPKHKFGGNISSYLIIRSGDDTMAKYTIDTIRENSDFLNFAKSEYGYGSFDDIPLWEQNAIFYKFKAKEDDLDDNDFSVLDGAAKNDKLEDIAKIYYPGEKLENLQIEDLAFAQAMALSLQLPSAPSLQELKKEKEEKTEEFVIGAEEKNYSREELETILKAHEVYLLAPDQVQNNELLKEMDANYESTHGDLFTQTVVQGTIDIADFAKGDLTIDDDAADSMQKYIETFGKEYIGGKYVYTPEAEAALKKLDSVRNQINEKDNVVDKTPSGVVIINEGEKDNTNNLGNIQDKIPGGVILGGVEKDNNSMQKDGADNRIRSDHNLLEELRFDSLRLGIMRNMEVITQEEYDQNIVKLKADAKLQDSVMAAQFIEESEGKIKDIKAYQNNMVDAMISSDLISKMTPELTVIAYDNLQNRIRETLKKDKKADVSAEIKSLSNVRQTMDSLQEDFQEKRGYFLLDVTNAADAYDGYKHMFETRQGDLENENKDIEKLKAQKEKENDTSLNAEMDRRVSENNAKIDKYKQSSENLEEIIKNYDTTWNLPETVENPKSTAIDFNDRINKSSKILDEMNFDEATLGKDVLKRIERFQFKDDKGAVLPQFMDPKNPETKSVTWKEGMVVDPDGRLATVLRMAGNDVIMQGLGSKEKITKEAFTEELKGNIDFKLFEIYNSEETILGAIEDPEKFTKKKDQYLQEFQAKLNNPEIPLGISEIAYNAAMDVQTNNTEVFANRLQQKLGKSNAEYTTSKLYENVSKIDRRASTRGKNSKDIKKGATKRALFGIAMGGSMAYIGSRLVTNAAATGGASAVAGSAVALGVAIGAGIAATAVQVWSRKRAAKREGTKYGWKEFGKDKMLWASIATTSLACASAAFAMTQAPELAVPAAACAIASFGVGTGLRFAQPYRDMRLKGHSKTKAFVLGAVNAAAVLAGGYFGRQDGLNDVGPSHKETTTFKAVRDGDSKTYSDEHIKTVTDRNNANSTWEYRGEGSHDIPAYRNSDNYSNEAWWSSDQHDKAVSAMKEQMPKLGWKEGAGNEEVMLRKLAAFERLHRNGDFKLPDGETVTQKFGDLKGLLNGLLEGHLSPEGAQQLDKIQFNVGEDGHSKILDSLGKDLYSYNDHPHGIEVKANFHAEPTTTVEDIPAHTPGGGVFGWVSSSWNKFKKAIRPGAKADQVVKVEKQKPIENPTPPIIIPEKPKEDPTPPIIIPEKPKEIPVDKMLIDEYKIVYGIEPNMEEGKDKQWKDYCKRVEEERKVDAPKSSMNDFLLDRRKKLDEMIMNNVVSENDVTKAGRPIRKDYLAKQAKDERGKAGIVMEARENLMQSNLTKDNFVNKITLSHFTKFIKHFVNKDEVVADGSRNISLNPQFKGKIDKEGSKVAVTDLNQYLVEGKPLDVAKQRVSGKDAHKTMEDINKHYERANAKNNR